MKDCIFCYKNINKNKILAETKNFYAIRDIYPVSNGHNLIIPKNHLNNFFELDTNLYFELWNFVSNIKNTLDIKHSPDGYNIGVNCGKAAGQTVFHLHIHLIPRYNGDIENPKGGVRGVIPDKRIY